VPIASQTTILKEQLCLGRKRTSIRIFRKALTLEIVKRIVEPSVRIQKMKVMIIVEELATSEMKEETAHRIRARNVGAPAALGSFASTTWRTRMMVINLERLAPYKVTAQGERS
jgi:hypothetical protein